MTGHWTATGIGASAFAFGTGHRRANRYWGLAAKHRFSKVDSDDGLDIGATGRSAWSASATKRRSTVEEHVEDVAEPTTAAAATAEG